MVGIMSGAITNTPGLGAAQQAYADISGKLETIHWLWDMLLLILSG